MRAKRTTFKSTWVPALLLAPQLAITAVFFLWPAAQAIWSSVLREDAFGTKKMFVGLANFSRLFGDPTYLEAAGVTVFFSLAVGILSLAIGLLLATLTEFVTTGKSTYRMLLFNRLLSVMVIRLALFISFISIKNTCEVILSILRIFS